MVDEGGDAPVGVQLEVLRVLLLADLNVDVDDVVVQPELLEDNGDLPARIKSFASQLGPDLTVQAARRKIAHRGLGPMTPP